MYWFHVFDPWLFVVLLGYDRPAYCYLICVSVSVSKALRDRIARKLRAYHLERIMRYRLKFYRDFYGPHHLLDVEDKQPAYEQNHTLWPHEILMRATWSNGIVALAETIASNLVLYIGPRDPALLGAVRVSSSALYGVVRGRMMMYTPRRNSRAHVAFEGEYNRSRWNQPLGRTILLSCPEVYETWRIVWRANVPDFGRQQPWDRHWPCSVPVTKKFAVWLLFAWDLRHRRDLRIGPDGMPVCTW